MCVPFGSGTVDFAWLGAALARRASFSPSEIISSDINASPRLASALSAGELGPGLRQSSALEALGRKPKPEPGHEEACARRAGPDSAGGVKRAHRNDGEDQ